MHTSGSKLRQGIDLATPFSQRDTSDDLDHIMMDAMLEGFDTGVSCLSFALSFVAKKSGNLSEADSARHVVEMGQLFSKLRTPNGSPALGIMHA